jgi:hypothetical protein
LVRRVSGARRRLGLWEATVDVGECTRDRPMIVECRDCRECNGLWCRIASSPGPPDVAPGTSGILMRSEFEVLGLWFKLEESSSVSVAPSLLLVGLLTKATWPEVRVGSAMAVTGSENPS